MPPKRKDFAKSKGKAKAKVLILLIVNKMQNLLILGEAAVPVTENDFLEAADTEEEGAGKWRMGDINKAVRFYNRAIDLYNSGLVRYPTSFDLAYNKANLQYNMSEDARIVAVLGNRIALLEETLHSHRFAISLGTDNTDVLFNTAQVLTSLAEAVLEEGAIDFKKVSARTLLEEAVDIFTKCLDSQQRNYEQTQAEFAKANMEQEQEQDQDQEVSPSGYDARRGSSGASSTSSSAPGDWATVIEPLTPESILETCTAQLGAMTTLISLYGSAEFGNTEVMTQTGLDTARNKIPALINLIQEPPTKVIEESLPGPTLSLGSSPIVDEPESFPKDDAILASANFQAAVADMTFRRNSNLASAIQYASQVEQLFAFPTQEPPMKDGKINIGVINSLSSYSDALIDVASAIMDSSFTDGQVEASEIQWTALSQAQTILTQLATFTATLAPARLAGIFLARGDTDLFRFRLSRLGTAKPTWAKSTAVLVGNAGVFYRGARAYAEKAGAGALETKVTANAKATIAEILKEANGGTVSQKEHWRGTLAKVVDVLTQMVEEGVVDKDDAEGVVKFTS
ncbi:hypothetical protein B0J11DRAFT_579266 [Dendryphion nanum]|uniref:Uncharacterized protein n=1 Tax=Dendryphion nanum TaxID=256645 RepID=A0A9P9DWS5_9PLEO|nr:hypothetical protein B0J11DRAFT_579266 [Dendryphion nanum]